MQSDIDILFIFCSEILGQDHAGSGGKSGKEGEDKVYDLAGGSADGCQGFGPCKLTDDKCIDSIV